MADFEKLGVFYLGRPYDLAASKPREGYLLYDSKDLVTHALCVGMTGSGKTGLCLGLLEEAALDGIPAIVIDPKGDLGNLLLTFPDLAPQDFEPWINPDEARSAGLSTAEFAAREAQRWKQGLAGWGEDGERIRRLREAADFVIYTPGSNAGLPVSILKSFAAPGAAVLEDEELLRERVATAAASLLGLLGIEADPLQSREHILLATLFDQAWRSGRELDLAGLIQSIQTPPVKRIGVLDLDSFYPSKDRFQLALRLNNLLASPTFGGWLEGEPLDIGAALHGPSGKPRISIYSIAHLSESERMFFVSLLLSQMVSWMRQQSGTTSLRALLYMDEIFGYFPPVANPPSKRPLLTLLKQARAYGLGVVLATQNPVDLDYKGLANAGTWFLGRLQTERDKQRVLEGLEGAAAQAGSGFDRQKMESTLAGLGKRVFLMNNVHESAPIVFESRWTMCYLGGPLTRTQIKRLMDPLRASAGAASTSPAAATPRAPASVSAAAPITPITPSAPPAAPPRASPPTRPLASNAADSSRPVLPPEIAQFFLPVRQSAPAGATLEYMPGLFASSAVYYQDAKLGLDQQDKACVIVELDPENPALDWSKGSAAGIDERELEHDPQPGANFSALPPLASKAKSYDAWKKLLVDTLFREARLELFKSVALGVTSQAGESERDFRIRLQQKAREARDAASEALRQKYAPKHAALEERRRRAQAALDVQKQQSSESKVHAALSFGATLLGAFTGRKLASATNITRASSAARSVSRTLKESGDVGRAAETVESVAAQLQQLDEQFRTELAELEHSLDPASEVFEKQIVHPKKTNITVSSLVLAWMPHWRTSEGRAIPAWG